MHSKGKNNLRAPLVVILLAALLSACGSPKRGAVAAPSFGITAGREAWRDCGGAAQEWTRTAQTSMRPYRREVWITMRCVGTGALVGPYYYNLPD